MAEAYNEEVVALLQKELTTYRSKQITTVLTLLNEGNTVPFIARYRKEMTGSLDEVQIREIEERYHYLQNLKKRKEEVLRLIEEQGKLTKELKTDIQKAVKMQQVEDLYRPYKQKRRTKATIAKEKGLEPLADWLLSLPENADILAKAATFINEEKEVATAEIALQGAHEILAERISDEPKYRTWLRDYMVKHAQYVSVVNDYFQRQLIGKQATSLAAPYIEAAYLDSYKRFIGPAIEREIRNELTEKADEQAIAIFGENLRNLLLQSPLKGKVVLGFDPAYRTGCKLAVVDETGKVLAIQVIYPHKPATAAKREAAGPAFKKIIEDYQVDMVAIGNGTASRESELFVAEQLKAVKRDVFYVIVNEAGASVYSASEVARKEFPDLQVEERSAVSIARRLQDPLAELVKIDPKAVGVGQYQHDVSQKRLAEQLDFVVETAVNQVGVDVNTASAQLLQHISGLNKTTAQNLVTYRDENGVFTARNQVKKVPRLGPKAFEQAIGFLRIPNGKNVLDNTGIHPESYPVAQAILEKAEIASKELGTAEAIEKLKQLPVNQLATELEVGSETLTDIIASLIQPGRDMRDEMSAPLLRKDVLTMEDLKPGMEMQGTVRNVIDFGAFVDIGVKQDGLVHISKLSTKFVKHPTDVVAVGDVVTVWVEDVDLKKGRISLTMLPRADRKE
ncbi:TPA: Tex family protein [Enterococcus faecalis]